MDSWAQSPYLDTWRNLELRLDREASWGSWLRQRPTRFRVGVCLAVALVPGLLLAVRGSMAGAVLPWWQHGMTLAVVSLAMVLGIGGMLRPLHRRVRPHWQRLVAVGLAVGAILVELLPTPVMSTPAAHGHGGGGCIVIGLGAAVATAVVVCLARRHRFVGGLAFLELGVVSAASGLLASYAACTSIEAGHVWAVHAPTAAVAVLAAVVLARGSSHTVGD
ncbi:MAG: hypothetical protein K0V04_23110 [Deltaproteobacteria bacterium]|nr:hypothetical protein [Deltaproteobacteria bacterium]